MTARRPAEETARLGDEIYERDIRPRVEDTHDGAFVAIDVESGRWVIADSELAAADSLRAEEPDAINVWLLRVGYRAVASIGGGAPAEEPMIEGAVNAASQAIVGLQDVGRVAIEARAEPPPTSPR